jgi:hypothetical protein
MINCVWIKRRRLADVRRECVPEMWRSIGKGTSGKSKAGVDGFRLEGYHRGRPS